MRPVRNKNNSGRAISTSWLSSRGHLPPDGATRKRDPIDWLMVGSSRSISRSLAWSKRLAPTMVMTIELYWT